MEVYDHERCDGVIVQFGGQTPLNIAQALRAAGANVIGTSPDDIDRAEDRDFFKALVAEVGPTCVLCPDDYSCLGALWLLESQGIRIPEDISLVGYDGIRMSQMITPRLTTYRQDTVQIAREVFTLITDAINSPESHIPKQVTVHGMLIEGETVR